MKASKKLEEVHLGFEVGTGEPVSVPIKHMVVTGQTQESGKTTTLEALISRSGLKALAFVTKRGEGTFPFAQKIQPYFREQTDWKYVAAILEASRGEKLKWERANIIRASKGARTLADVQTNVRNALEKARGQSADAYLCLDAYLEEVVPMIAQTEWASSIALSPGVNVMDLEAMSVEMQHLVLRSSIEWVLNHERQALVVIPEAWKFIPQGRGTPVQLAAESFIRQAAGLPCFLWLDSQDIAGVQKIILKSVPVWLLGVQRESNEIARTLAQIPAGLKKPKAVDIATLELGQFIVCFGKTIVKVYVQPAWMGTKTAIGVAKGEIDMNAINFAKEAAEQGYIADPRVWTKTFRELKEMGKRTLDAISEPPYDHDRITNVIAASIDGRADEDKAKEREAIDEMDQRERQKYEAQVETLQRMIHKLLGVQTSYEEWLKTWDLPDPRADQSIPFTREEASRGPCVDEPKKGTFANPYPEDFEDLVAAVTSRVLAHIPTNGRVQVEAREVVLKEFQSEEVARVLALASKLTPWQRKVIRFVEAKGNQTEKIELLRSILGARNTASVTGYQDKYREVDESCNLGFLRRDQKGRIYPNLKACIESRLSTFEASDAEIEDVRGQIMLLLK